MFQAAQRLEAGPRAMIRTLPFADFWQVRVRVAVGVDPPEPFAMDAVNKVLLDVVPDAASRFEKRPGQEEMEGLVQRNKMSSLFGIGT